MREKLQRLESENYRLQAENKRLRKIVSSEANALASDLLEAEQRVRESSRDLDWIIRNTPGLIAYWDCNLINRFGNKAYAEWFGVNADSLPGMHVRDVIGEENYRRNCQFIEAALRGERQQFERSIPTSDGNQTRQVLVQYIPDIVAEEVHGLYTMVTDITLVRHAELAMHEAQKVGGVGSFRLDIANDRWTSSDSLDDIFGIDAAYVRNTDGWAQRVHPDDRDELMAYWQTTAAHKSHFDRDYRIVRASDGVVRWVHGLGRISCNERGEATQFFGSVQDITERKLQDAHLLEQMAVIRLREQALNQISQGVLITDSSRLTTYVNDEFTRITGYAREEMLGRACAILQSADSQPEVVLQMRAALDAQQPFHGEILNCRKDGTPFWNDLSMNPVFDDAGNVTQYVGVLRDVTERKKALEDLKLFKKCINHANDVIVITEAEPFDLPGPKILFVNDAYERTTGYTREEAIGGTPRMLQGPKTDLVTIKRMGQALRQWQPVREEVLNYTKDGREFWSEIDIVPLANDAGWYTHWISIQRDITARKKAEELVHQLAYYDPLTKLANRELLNDRLGQSMKAGQRSGRYGALMFMDLDNFKSINDTQGHGAGDLLLIEAALRLKACIRQIDSVARFGGDELVVLLNELPSDRAQARNQAELVAEKIRSVLSKPYVLQTVASEGGAIRSLVHNCTVSIGVALFMGQENPEEDVLKWADLAMYKAKDSGRNTVCFFDSLMQIENTSRVVLEEDLREAIRTKQFSVYYQAQVTGKREITGVEALLRWQHPTRGWVAPAEFIPKAEKTGLIVSLGLWALEAACTQLARWSIRPEMANLTMAINTTARQFHQADFVDQVLAVLARTGANPKQIKLELTESMLITDVESVITKMKRLKDTGISFSLDDFGTGYSSLSSLKRLPLEQLKIAQEFVRDILIDPNDMAIARMVVALADSMDLLVIAEGVETEEQREFLAGLGCHHYQGYLFSQALPAPEFEALLARR